MVVMSWRVYHILEDMVTSDVKHCGFPQTRRPFMFGLLIDFIPALIHFCPQEEKITLILYWNQSKHSAGWQNDHQPCSCLPDVFFIQPNKNLLVASSHRTFRGSVKHFASCSAHIELIISSQLLT